jgi:Family of unknown function (DUF6653)
MTMESRVAALFHLTGENWMKHANPWSVGTRYSVLPVIVLALWSRIWIGWWSAVPAAVSLAWMFFNPILFSRPRSTKNWASKSVLGERVWQNRNRIPVPALHRTMPQLLNVISSLGMLLAIWAIVALWVWPAVLGVAIAYLGKSWYLDRMVWIYEDMKETPEYREWLY